MASQGDHGALSRIEDLVAQARERLLERERAFAQGCSAARSQGPESCWLSGRWMSRRKRLWKALDVAELDLRSRLLARLSHALSSLVTPQFRSRILSSQTLGDLSLELSRAQGAVDQAMETLEALETAGDVLERSLERELAAEENAQGALSLVQEEIKSLGSPPQCPPPARGHHGLAGLAGARSTRSRLAAQVRQLETDLAQLRSLMKTYLDAAAGNPDGQGLKDVWEGIQGILARHGAGAPASQRAH